MCKVLKRFLQQLMSREYLTWQYVMNESYVINYVCLDVKVGVCEGCEAAVIAGTRCGWGKFRECDDLRWETFPLMLKGTVHKSHV